MGENGRPEGPFWDPWKSKRAPPIVFLAYIGDFGTENAIHEFMTFSDSETVGQMDAKMALESNGKLKHFDGYVDWAQSSISIPIPISSAIPILI